MFPRSSTLLLALPLALFAGASLAAQDLTVKALTNASVLARSGSQAQLQTIKAGTFVSVNESQAQQTQLPAIGINATSNSGSAGIGLRAGPSPLEIVPNRGFLFGLNASFMFLGSTTGDGSVATTTATSASGAQQAPISFLVTFRQPSTVKGDLVLSWYGLNHANSNWTATVDIGNDNSVEFSADSTKETNRFAAIPVAFANGPIDVKVTFSGSSQGTPSSPWNVFESLKISLDRTGSCNLVSYGSSCGGAKMDAGMFSIGKSSVLAVNLSGGVQNGFFVRVIGEKRTDLPLPGTCRLLAEPTIVQLLRSDANGAYKESFMVPANMNFIVTLQYVPFDLVGTQIQARATNAWEMKCSGF